MSKSSKYEEYSKIEGINASMLIQLAKDPYGVYEMLTNKEERKSQALDFGSYVDALITSPEEVEDRFIIVDLPRLTPGMKDFADEIVRLKIENKDSGLDEETLIFTARDRIGFNPSWKATTILNAVAKAKSYIDVKYIAESTDRVIITREDHNKAMQLLEAYESFKTKSEIFKDVESIEYQVPLVVEYVCEEIEGKYPIKGLLDMVIKYRDGSYRVVDIKTYTGDFATNIKKYSLHYQLAFYEYLLTKHLSSDGLKPMIRTSAFIAIEKTGRRNVTAYYLPPKLAHAIFYYDAKEGRSIKSLLIEAIRRIKTNDWTSAPNSINDEVFISPEDLE